MTQVPVITQKHYEAAWASALAPTMSAVDICNKAIEIAFAEQEELENEANESINQLVDKDMQDQFISAKEAESLGVGSAEYSFDNNVWYVCKNDCEYSPLGRKYRAIRKEVPAEPIDHAKLLGEIYGFLQSTCPEGIADEAFRIVPEALRERLRHSQEAGRIKVEPHAALKDNMKTSFIFNSLKTDASGSTPRVIGTVYSLTPIQSEPTEPHAELRALYAQQVKDGTLDDFVWEYKHSHSDGKKPVLGAPMFGRESQYFCTPKPTCQVRNDDTGVTEPMTREAAQKLQAETKDVCDWLAPGNYECATFSLEFNANGIYTYKRKLNLVNLDGVDMTREAAIAIWESKKDTCDVRSSVCGHTTLELNPRFSLFSPNAEYQLHPKAKKQAILDPAIREGVIALLQELGLSK